MHEAGNENIYLLLLIISNIVIHDLIQEHRDFYAAPQPWTSDDPTLTLR